MKAKMKTCPCGGTIEKGEDWASFLVGGRKVKKLLPAMICQKNGEVYFDGPMLLRVEKKLQREAVAA